MASDARSGFSMKDKERDLESRRTRSSKGVTSGVRPPDTWGGSDHERRKKRTREHEGRETVGKGENSDSMSKSESRLERNHSGDESPLVNTAKNDSDTDTPMADTADNNAGGDEDEDGDVSIWAPLPSGPACEHTNSISDSDPNEEMGDDLAN